MTVRAKANKHVTNAEIPSQYFNFYERWKIRVSAISDAGGRCSHCGIATHSHDFGVLTHKEAWLKDLTKQSESDGTSKTSQCCTYQCDHAGDVIF